MLHISVRLVGVFRVCKSVGTSKSQPPDANKVVYRAGHDGSEFVEYVCRGMRIPEARRSYSTMPILKAPGKESLRELKHCSRYQESHSGRRVHVDLILPRPLKVVIIRVSWHPQWSAGNIGRRRGLGEGRRIDLTRKSVEQGRSIGETPCCSVSHGACSIACLPGCSQSTPWSSSVMVVRVAAVAYSNIMETLSWSFWDSQERNVIYPSPEQLTLRMFENPRYIAMRQFRASSLSGLTALYAGDIILMQLGDRAETFLLRHDGMLEGEFRNVVALDLDADYRVIGNQHELSMT